MREILFRGQTRRLGEKVWMNGEKVPSNWVYGGICLGKGAFSIIYDYMDEEGEKPIEKHVVYTDTVGQYTGLTDKNGKKIFEGDIIKADNWLHQNMKIYTIVFEDSGFYAKHKDEDCWNFDHLENIEIIGNIYDNPELLKGE